MLAMSWSLTTGPASPFVSCSMPAFKHSYDTDQPSSFTRAPLGHAHVSKVAMQAQCNAAAEDMLGTGQPLGGTTRSYNPKPCTLSPPAPRPPPPWRRR
jgi:hypothetical protein